MSVSTAVNPYSPINLIRSEFNCSLQELKALTLNDRHQLASAIARQRGITPVQMGFEPDAKLAEY